MGPLRIAVQVRLVTFPHGRTEVRMSGSTDATWPAALGLNIAPSKGTGWLGFDVLARARFHVVVAGTPYDWEGDIPYVPKIPLATKNGVIFDPWAWKVVGVQASPSATIALVLSAISLLTARGRSAARGARSTSSRPKG